MEKEERQKGTKGEQTDERENRRKGRRRDEGGGEAGEGVKEKNSSMSRIPHWVWKHTCNPSVQETEAGGLPRLRLRTARATS